MGLIEARGIQKTYADIAVPVEVLCGVDFDLEEGEAVGVFGASGSGKSTLLHLLGGLDRPTSGSVRAAGLDLNALPDEALARFRNREVGFVFQFYHLLPEFTALENVMLPPLIAGHGRKTAQDAAREALVSVGLEARLSHRPARLSGGEQQRVAIARAVVQRPRMLLADEPTGNLDSETGRRVWEYLIRLREKTGMALVVVTHNRELTDGLSRACELRDGRIAPTVLGRVTS